MLGRKKTQLFFGKTFTQNCQKSELLCQVRRTGLGPARPASQTGARQGLTGLKEGKGPTSCIPPTWLLLLLLLLLCSMTHFPPQCGQNLHWSLPLSTHNDPLACFKPPNLRLAPHTLSPPLLVSPTSLLHPHCVAQTKPPCCVSVSSQTKKATPTPSLAGQSRFYSLLTQSGERSHPPRPIRYSRTNRRKPIRVRASRRAPGTRKAGPKGDEQPIRTSRKHAFPLKRLNSQKKGRGQKNPVS